MHFQIKIMLNKEKRSSINRKRRYCILSPGFLCSATWPLMPKKDSNGLIN